MNGCTEAVTELNVITALVSPQFGEISSNNNYKYNTMMQATMVMILMIKMIKTKKQ